MESQHKRKRRRVAIVGTGLAGLTAAYLLAEEGSFEVELFERSERIGMDAAGITVNGQRVDSPMRAVQGGYYTRLLRLYRRLGVQLERSNFDYAFLRLSPTPPTSTPSPRASKTIAEEAPSIRPSLLYNGSSGLVWPPFSFPSSSSTSSFDLLPTSLRIDLTYVVQVAFFALCYIYLLLLSFYHVWSGHTSRKARHWIAQSTFSSFVETTYLPSSFVHTVLVPLFSCVATCSPAELAEYPAAELLEYVAATFGTDHYLVSGGVQRVVSRLLARIPKQSIHTSTELLAIRPILGGQAGIELENSAGERWAVDHLILATQANQAQRLLRLYYKALKDAPPESLSGGHAALQAESERIAALSAFKYTRSIVVNHYDAAATLAPGSGDRRALNLAAWDTAPAAVNAEGGSTDTELLQASPDHVMATHDLSTRAGSHISESGKPLLQTTNPTVPLQADKIVSSQVFERARVTLESRHALHRFLDCKAGAKARSDGFQGLNGVWLVGAWAAEGIPLLEGCVESAERICAAIARGTR